LAWPRTRGRGRGRRKRGPHCPRLPRWSPGTDVMIIKIFSQKNLVKILAFLLKLLLVFAKIVIITLVFEKTPIFSPKIGKNRRKFWS
jgi:hypothetical protein